MRRLIVWFVFPFVRKRFGSVWRLKEAINGTQPGLKRSVLCQCYWRWCADYGSWIGLEAEVKGIPVLPHDLHGIFISGQAQIGRDCILYHQVTIGSDLLASHGGAPCLGDNVYVGAGAKIIGPIHVGNNCRIGANACVYKDVPDNCVVVGNPMRILQRDKLDNTFYSRDNSGWLRYVNSRWERCDKPSHIC